MEILPLFSQLISDCWPLQCIVHTQRIARQICLYSISPIFHKCHFFGCYTFHLKWQNLWANAQNYHLLSFSGFPQICWNQAIANSLMASQLNLSQTYLTKSINSNFCRRFWQLFHYLIFFGTVWRRQSFYFVFFTLLLSQLWPTQLPKLANLTAPLQIWFVPRPEMQLLTIRRWGRNKK